MQELLQELRLNDKVDYLVIDTPPVLAVADGLALVSQVDAVILAARLNRTTRDEAARGARSATPVGSPRDRCRGRRGKGRQRQLPPPRLLRRPPILSGSRRCW